MPDTKNEPIMPGADWLDLTPRQMELQLWQLLLDMGGEVSTIPPDDLPGRKVMFYRDHHDYIGMIANEESADG